MILNVFMEDVEFMVQLLRRKVTISLWPLGDNQIILLISSFLLILFAIINVNLKKRRSILWLCFILIFIPVFTSFIYSEFAHYESLILFIKLLNLEGEHFILVLKYFNYISFKFLWQVVRRLHLFLSISHW